MSQEEFTRCGSGEHEQRHACALRHRPIAFIELITTAALALSTAVAVTAVSIGIARADLVGAVAKTQSASFAIALAIGMLLPALTAVGAFMAPSARSD